MIRPIDIRLNAAHPDYPLAEAVTFTGSPSTVLIRGVPPNCGRWAITAVSVAATFPDGSTTTRAAVQSANGVWVATLPATATSGRTANGLRILADGIDENGAAVTGYILGVADFAVASLGVTPAPEPGETSYQMLYFDAVPGVLRKGDVAKVDGVLKFYNGTAWEAFAGDIPAPSTATPAMDGTGAAGTSAAFARGDHVHPTDTSRMAATATGADIAVSGTDATKIDAALAGKASKSDATLTPVYSDTPTFSEWVCDPATVTYSGGTIELAVSSMPPENPVVDILHPKNSSPSAEIASLAYSPTALSRTFTLPSAFNVSTVTATRVRTDIIGYTLGSQTDKPLASEAEAEALRTGKQDALSQTQLANIAAVSDALAFDAAHSYAAGDPVVYNGTLYTFTTAHTGAWTGSDVSAVDIIARLAAKLDKGGPNNRKIQWNADSGFLEVVDSNSGNLIFPNNLYGSAEFVASREYVDDKDSKKLDSTSAAPAFSSDSSTQYPVGSHCTYQGKLYKCTTATTGGTWVAATWTADTASNYFQYALASKTIDNGAVTLDDRAINAVAVSSSLASLTVNFPTATSGRVRDFGLRLTVASGITTAPQIVLPQGVTCENADGEAPEIGADGAATILYFTETASGVFLVKGEVLQTITQA